MITFEFLTEQRQAVRDRLVARGLRSAEYVGEAIATPTAIVVPGSPYLSWSYPDQVFGELQLTLQVLILLARDVEKTTTAAMDQQIAKVLAALAGDADLDEDPYEVSAVSQPGVVTINGSKFFGSVITITTTTEEP